MLVLTFKSVKEKKSQKHKKIEIFVKIFIFCVKKIKKNIFEYQVFFYLYIK